MQNKNIYILAIESSCDDTACAVMENDRVLSNVVSGQEVHKKYGGIVPELAGRNHQKNIVSVVHAAVKKARIDLNQLSAIAVTRGPGLSGSLLVGLNFAKSIALTLNIPLIEVNHMQAHILAHFITNNNYQSPDFPFICLTVSGGHTQLVKVNSELDHEILGETLDDAAGEAFDKIAKMMGLEYPGGPLIDKYAMEGNPDAYVFPDTKIAGPNFSFSGLKTAFLYFLEKEIKKTPSFVQQNLHDLCASVQKTIIKQLTYKTEEALKQTNIKHLAVAGGVSANSALRKAIYELGQKLGVQTYIPPFEYCTDNAAMIGITAYFKFKKKEFSPLSIAPFANS